MVVSAATVLDPNIVCPMTGEELIDAGGSLVTHDGRNIYPVNDGILELCVDDDGGPVTATVQSFYTEAPFPNYNDLDDVGALARRARESVFARLLAEQIPVGSKVLEVGCGTGQLSNYLAAVCMAKVYAADMTLASLRLATAFARENKLGGIRFLQMNLFRPCIRPGSMDIVISNGVLHHTADTRKAFLSIAPLVKPGGHVIIGLYNKIGRLRTDFRRAMYRRFGEWTLILDPHLRKTLSPAKRQAWIRDQYCHPHERKHSFDEVLGWFEEAGFSFVSSIPKISGSFSGHEHLFEPQSSGGKVDRFYAQTGMLFSGFGGEGGLFIMIGRRRI